MITEVIISSAVHELRDSNDKLIVTRTAPHDAGNDFWTTHAWNGVAFTPENEPDSLYVFDSVQGAWINIAQVD